MPSVLPSQKPVFHFGLALNRGTLRLPPLCLWRKLLPKGIKYRWHLLPEAREWGEEEKDLAQFLPAGTRHRKARKC